MGNFEKLSVLVIVVIIVMILVVALYTWQDNGDDTTSLDSTKDADPATAALVDEGPQERPWPTDALGADQAGDSRSGEGLPPGDLLGEEPVNLMDDIDPVVVPAPELDGGDPAGVPAEPETPGEEPSDPAESDEPWMYTVKHGDTLSHISERELGTIRRMKEIMKLNPQLDPLKIRAGDQIKMPPRGRMSSTRGMPGADPAGTDSPSSRGGTISTGDYYVSKPGDRLQSIAKRAYGSMDRWPELWARNLSSVPNIDDDLPVGTRVFIPK